MSALVKPDLSSFITVPELLRFQYEHNPTQAAFVFAREDSPRKKESHIISEENDSIQNEITEISFLEYVHAAHRVAHLVRPDRSGPERAIVGVVALLDNHVYQTVVAGIMQAGLVPLLISPRLTAAAVLNLLKLAGAHRLLITGTTLRDLLQETKELLASSSELGHAYEVTFEEAPSLEQLYPKLGTEKAEDAFKLEYPWVSDYPKSEQTAVYLHSSGSTGLPKAIPVTHGMMLYSFSSPLNAYSTYKNLKVPLRVGLMALPPFHIMAFFSQLLFPIYATMTVALFPPKVTKPDALPMLATPEDMIKHIQLTHSNAVALVPMFLQIYSKDERSIEVLKGLESVVFAGGPLAPATGDYLVKCGVRLRQVYGLTEVGLPMKLNLEGGFEDWAWHHFEGDKGDQPYIRWSPLGDGTSELQILRTDRWKPAVENLEDVPGYATSDIFTPHPTKPGLWAIVGRTDDVIIHSSGEKTTALPIEHVVIQNPSTQGAVVFGRQREQAGILIEPTTDNHIDVTDEAAVSRFRNKIWPFIEKANDVSPAYSKIYKEMILVTSKDKPLPRAAKGTVMRKAAYSLYEKEINKIYEAVESNTGNGSVAPPSTWEHQDVQSWILTQVVDLCGNRVELSDDLFEHGFDSLSATVLRLRIAGALRTSEEASIRGAAQRIDQTTVYKNPTVESLAKFIVELSNDSGEDIDPTIAISRMIEKYSQGLDVPLRSIQNGIDSHSKSAVVLLTGSTGNLGAQILSSLLLNDNVARVYTLNRSSTRLSLLDRHIERFEDKALDVNLLSSDKLIYLEGEASQLHLGLEGDLYNEILQNVTIIIHNAWRLDFNLALSSFEPHIRGTRNVIDFARASAHASSLRLLFTSSIASTQSWNTATQGSYADHIDANPRYAVGGGYGESKYVTERILEKSGLCVSILRIGQISGGSPNGAWAMSDWFPMMVKSSLALNMLPDAHGVVSWAPMDAISDAILDVAFTPQDLPLVVNLVHPFPVSWTSVMEAIRKTLITAKNLDDSNALPLVPLSNWVAALEEAGNRNTATEQTSIELPASKIVGFIQNMVLGEKLVARYNGDLPMEAAGLTSLDTINARRISSRMRCLAPIGLVDTEMWIKYWIKKGL
ncbi:acetyl-CoA synthetase-like protein [Lentinula aciculospora]|uniref:Acetyl-CoA synthetase-like protein n=1 Tax=Lentinula aciculospora TaxID=153920 RepID=A0A9W9A4N5_9AGAR|nr:acetyl-CoA synthetase-like protein [Lentinula aciculospora]